MTSQRCSLDVPVSGTPSHRSGADPNEYPTGLTTPINTPMPARLAVAVAFIETHAAETPSAGTTRGWRSPCSRASEATPITMATVPAPGSGLLHGQVTSDLSVHRG